MKLSFWQVITIPLLLGLVLSWVLFSESEAEIEATISAAQALSGGDTEGYFQALGPREFVFPGDHGAHPGFKTEWWYYTGNLFTEEGKQFGYQFTIFRNQLSPSVAGNASSLAQDNDQQTSQAGSTDPAQIKPDDSVRINPEAEGAQNSVWNTNQLYLAHFAISDVSKKEHVFDERYSRGDYIFHCKVHELYADANPMLEEGKSEMQQMFNSLLRSFTGNNRHYNYHHNDTQLVWLSFALKRVRDNAFNRTFPTFDNVWRNSRVW